MNLNNVFGNGVLQEFPQQYSIDRLANKPKGVAEIPSIECGNWLLHKHYTRHEYKITKNLVDEALASSYGHNEYANYLKGLILRREGKIQESLECFRDSYTVNCTNVENIKQIAKSLFLLADHKRAIDAYLEAEKISSFSDWQIYHRLGESYIASHFLAEAMRELLKATQLTRDKIPHITLAQIAISNDKVDYAIEIYNRIIQCANDNSEALIQLGLVYLKQDEVLRAFQAFGTVLALSPTCVRAILPLAYIIQNHKEYDVALSKYKSVAHSVFESWQLWNNIGMCFYGKHKFVAAVTCLKRACYLNPMAWQPTCNLGKVFLITGQPASAAIHLCVAVAASPRNHMSYLLLGLALRRLDDISGAERALSKAHSLMPRIPIILINYAIILQMQNKCAQAAEILSDLNSACSTTNVDLHVVHAAQQIMHNMNEMTC